jgi:hypothetical protein
MIMNYIHSDRSQPQGMVLGVGNGSNREDASRRSSRPSDEGWFIPAGPVEWQASRWPDGMEEDEIWNMAFLLSTGY